jgi:hypothetical protein
MNCEVVFEERDGKVYYFNGHLPVFVHEKSALTTFQLFSTHWSSMAMRLRRRYLVHSGTAGHSQTLREALPGGRCSGFFAPTKKRLASKLTEQVCQRAQELSDRGLEVPEVDRQLGILSDILHKAIRWGRLRPGKKRFIQRGDSQH